MRDPQPFHPGTRPRQYGPHSPDTPPRSPRPPLQRRLDLAFVGGVFVATALAYAVGLFSTTGGVVFLPADAAVVGILGAGLFGYRQSGLAFGWLAAYAPLLGAVADHYLLDLSTRPLAERIAAFLSPDGLAFLGVAAVVLGTLAWSGGLGGERSLAAHRSRA